MMFDEVIKQLQAGKYVTRSAWDQTGEYLVLLPGMQYIWKIVTIPNPSAGNWLPLVADMLSDDWKVV